MQVKACTACPSEIYKRMGSLMLISIVFEGLLNPAGFQFQTVPTKKRVYFFKSDKHQFFWWPVLISAFTADKWSLKKLQHKL